MMVMATPLFEDAAISTDVGRTARSFRRMEKQECRVLQVMNALSMGGGETWLMALLRYLKEAGDDLDVRLKFDVVLTSGRKALFDEEAEALGAKLYYLPYSRKRLAPFTQGMRRILAAGRYQVIHDHQDYPAGIHFLCGWGLLPTLRIAHIHNAIHDVERASNWRRDVVVSLEKKLLAHLATHIMATSQQMIIEYGFDTNSFSHLKRGAAYCGFDVTRFSRNHAEIHADVSREHGWEGSAKIMLFAGRLNSGSHGSDAVVRSGKNPGFALQVAREAMARDADLRLLLAGDGNARKEFEALVQSWGLQDRIRFLGVREDLPRLMVGADLLLFPSIAEGLGMVVVEAQAAGLRVLASDTTPRESVVLPEMVTFKSLSEPAAKWAQEAVRLITLPRPDALACNNAIRKSVFSIENSAARLIDLYTGTSANKLYAG